MRLHLLPDGVEAPARGHRAARREAPSGLSSPKGGTDCLKCNIHEQSSMSGKIACIREFATFVVFFASRLCFPTLVTRTRGCVWS